MNKDLTISSCATSVSVTLAASRVVSPQTDEKTLDA